MRYANKREKPPLYTIDTCLDEKRGIRKSVIRILKKMRKKVNIS